MQPLASRSILIVEDERPVRMLLRVVLEAAGATVVEAEHGSRALRLIELQPGGFDLIVTDLSMPEVGGAELIGRVRERWGASMPFVVCSALTGHPQYAQLRAHVDAIVTKPFAPQELVRAACMALVAGDDRRRHERTTAPHGDDVLTPPHEHAAGHARPHAMDGPAPRTARGRRPA